MPVGVFIFTLVVAAIAVLAVDIVRRKARRETFIRTYMFPAGVFEKLAAMRPSLAPKDQQLAARALRQFFLAFLKSGGKRVAMPSQVVDDLWHEFILFTREYQAFCNTAFGQFLHHTPAVTMGAVKVDNEGLRRVWWFSCLEENIKPLKATRLPLLFAIDRKLGIDNGFIYDLDCRRVAAAAVVGSAVVATTQCATAFTDRTIDGTTDGLGGKKRDAQGAGCGGSGAESGAGDGGGGSGGCGGGCGGGA